VDTILLHSRVRAGRHCWEMLVLGRFSARKPSGGPPRGRKEEEEGLYLRIETRKRVQTNEAKSKRRRASPT